MRDWYNMDSPYGIMEDAVKDHNDRMQNLRRTDLCRDRGGYL